MLPFFPPLTPSSPPRPTFPSKREPSDKKPGSLKKRGAEGKKRRHKLKGRAACRTIPVTGSPAALILGQPHPPAHLPAKAHEPLPPGPGPARWAPGPPPPAPNVTKWRRPFVSIWRRHWARPHLGAVPSHSPLHSAGPGSLPRSWVRNAAAELHTPSDGSSAPLRPAPQVPSPPRRPRNGGPPPSPRPYLYAMPESRDWAGSPNERPRRP